MNKELEHVHFLPYVGKNYETGINGKRIMALGESHYCANPKEDVPELTQNIIRWYLDSSNETEGWMNTYTKFVRALSGEALSRAESKEWWDKLLFYNYIQDPIIGPRITPTESQFKAAEEAFFKVLEEYEPDYIIVWGLRLYRELPVKGKQGIDINIQDGYSETWIYNIENRDIKVLPIYHPSSGFAWDYWHLFINAFINQ